MLTSLRRKIPPRAMQPVEVCARVQCEHQTICVPQSGGTTNQTSARTTKRQDSVALEVSHCSKDVINLTVFMLQEPVVSIIHCFPASEEYNLLQILSFIFYPVMYNSSQNHLQNNIKYSVSQWMMLFHMCCMRSQQLVALYLVEWLLCMTWENIYF